MYAEMAQMPYRLNDSTEGNHRMDAEITLAESLYRLHSLRVAALTGGAYDPDEFDHAVLSFRRAWEEARHEGSMALRQAA